MSENVRVPFSQQHDSFLVKYLAKYCPTKQNRTGNKVYKDLVENADGDWPWARHHPWQSWRERYKKHAEYFDAKISRYQERHGIRPNDSDYERPGTRKIKRPRVVSSSQASEVSRKRAVEDATHETQERPTKRPKVASGSTKTTATSARRPVLPIKQGVPVPDSADRRSKPERSESRLETSRTSPPREPDQPSVQPSPECEIVLSPGPPTMANGNEDNQPPPTTPPQYEKQTTAKLKMGSRETSVVQASPSEKPPPRELHNSSARRPLRKRHREPLTPFASTPPTPQTVVVNSPTPPDQTPIRAPPRFVNTFGRSCLVDQRGRTPKRYTDSGDGDGGEQNNEGERWPPIRRAKGKERADTNRLSHVTPQHHPFSQVQKISQTGANVSVVEQHAVGNHFTDRNEVDKRQEVDNIRSRHDRSKHHPHDAPHTVPERALRQPLLGAAPGLEPKPDAEAKVTPPRAPTPSPTTRMQPSSLARVSLQTSNGSRVEQVPSVDLAAFPASTSHKPSRPTSGLHSRQSLPAHLTPLPAGRDVSAPRSMWPNSRYGSPFFVRSHRQSYPGFAPSLSNVNSASARPFPTSAFTFAPPLNLPLAPAQVSSANATPPLHREPADILLTPHPPDVPLAAAQGLSSILSAMSVNHGLALDVVVAVYKRAGSLKETDRMLEGMREAAEEWAESALRRMGNRRDSRERRDRDEYREMELRYRKGDDVEDVSTRQSVSRRRSRRESQPRNRRITTELDYVLARPSVETPEYSPPETTRAAKWRRRSTGRASRSPVGVHRDENPIQSGKDDNDEGECGQVEQMLVNDGKDEDLSHVENHRVSHIGVPVTHSEPPRDHMHDGREEYHNIGALLQTMQPQELEKKLGRDNLRKQIGHLFQAK